MTTTTPLSTRRGLGGLTALGGGAMMVAAVFLPWLSVSVGDGSVTGWDTFRQASGSKQWFILETFSDGFSPFFTGLSVLVAGVLLALIGPAMLASLRGGAYRLPAAGIVLLGLLSLVVFLIGITNLMSWYASGSEVMSPEYGLYLLTAGATVGMLGVWVGIVPGRS